MFKSFKLFFYSVYKLGCFFFVELLSSTNKKMFYKHLIKFVEINPKYKKFYLFVLKAFLNLKGFYNILRLFSIKVGVFIKYLFYLFRGVFLLFGFTTFLYFLVVSFLDYFSFDVSVCNRIFLYFLILSHFFMVLQNDFSFYKELFDVSYLEHYDIVLNAGTLTEFSFLNKDIGVDEILEGDFTEMNLGTEAHILEDFDLILDTELDSLLFFDNDSVLPNKNIWYQECETSYRFLINSNDYFSDILDSLKLENKKKKVNSCDVINYSPSFYKTNLSDFYLYRLFFLFGIQEFSSLYLDKKELSKASFIRLDSKDDLYFFCNDILLKHPSVCDSFIYMLLSETNTNFLFNKGLDSFIWDSKDIIKFRLQRNTFFLGNVYTFYSPLSCLSKADDLGLFFHSTRVVCPLVPQNSLISFLDAYNNKKESYSNYIIKTPINSNNSLPTFLNFSPINLESLNAILSLYSFLASISAKDMKVNFNFIFFFFINSIDEAVAQSRFIKDLDLSISSNNSNFNPIIEERLCHFSHLLQEDDFELICEANPELNNLSFNNSISFLLNPYYTQYYNITFLNFPLYEGFRGLFVEDENIKILKDKANKSPLLSNLFTPDTRFLNPLSPALELKSKFLSYLTQRSTENLIVFPEFTKWYFRTIYLSIYLIPIKLINIFFNKVVVFDGNLYELQDRLEEINSGTNSYKFIDRFLLITHYHLNEKLKRKEFIFADFFFNRWFLILRKYLLIFIIKLLLLFKNNNKLFNFLFNQRVSTVDKRSLYYLNRKEKEVDSINTFHNLYEKFSKLGKTNQIKDTTLYLLSLDQLNTLNRWQKKERFFELSLYEELIPSSSSRSETSLGCFINFEFNPEFISIDEYQDDQVSNVYYSFSVNNDLFFNAYGEPKSVDMLDEESKKYLTYIYKPKFWDSEVDFTGTIYRGNRKQNENTSKHIFKAYNQPEDLPIFFGFLERVSFSWILIIMLIHYIYCHIQFDFWHYKTWFSRFQKAKRRQKINFNLPDKLIFGSSSGFKWENIGRRNYYQLNSLSNWFNSIPFYNLKKKELNSYYKLSHERRIIRNRFSLNLINFTFFGSELNKKKNLKANLSGLNANYPRFLNDFIRSELFLKTFGLQLRLKGFNINPLKKTKNKDLTTDYSFFKNYSSNDNKSFLSQDKKSILNQFSSFWSLFSFVHEQENRYIWSVFKESEEKNLNLNKSKRQFRTQYLSNFNRFKNLNYVENLSNPGLYRQTFFDSWLPFGRSDGSRDRIRFTKKTGFSFQKPNNSVPSRGQRLISRLFLKRQQIQQLPYFKKYKHTYFPSFTRQLPQNSFSFFFNSNNDLSLQIKNKNGKLDYSLNKVYPLSSIRKTQNYSWLLFHYRVGINGGNFFGYGKHHYSDLKKNLFFESRFHMHEDGNSAWDVTKYVSLLNFANLSVWWNSFIGFYFPFLKTTVQVEQSHQNKVVYNKLQNESIQTLLNQFLQTWDFWEQKDLIYYSILYNNLLTKNSYKNQFLVYWYKLKFLYFYKVCKYFLLYIYRLLLHIFLYLSKNDKLNLLFNGLVFIIITKQLLYVFNWLPSWPRDKDEMRWEEVTEYSIKSYRNSNTNYHLDHLCLIDSTLYDYYKLNDWNKSVDSHEYLMDHLRYDEYSLSGLFLDNILSFHTNKLSSFSSSDLIRWDLSNKDLLIFSDILFVKIRYHLYKIYSHYIIDFNTDEFNTLGSVCTTILEQHNYQAEDFSYYNEFKTFLKLYFGSERFSKLNSESLYIFWKTISNILIQAKIANILVFPLIDLKNPKLYYEQKNEVQLLSDSFIRSPFNNFQYLSGELPFSSYFRWNRSNLLSIKTHSDISLYMRQDLLSLYYMNKDFYLTSLNFSDILNSFIVSDISLSTNFQNFEIINNIFYQLKEIRDYVFWLCYLANKEYESLNFILSNIIFDFDLRPVNFKTEWQDSLYQEKQQIIFDYKDIRFLGPETQYYLKQGDLDKNSFSIKLNYKNFAYIKNFQLHFGAPSSFFRFKNNNILSKNNFLNDDAFLELFSKQIINPLFFKDPNYNYNLESQVYNRRFNIISSNQARLYYSNFLQIYYKSNLFNEFRKKFKLKVSIFSLIYRLKTTFLIYIK